MWGYYVIKIETISTIRFANYIAMLVENEKNLEECLKKINSVLEYNYKMKWNIKKIAVCSKKTPK